MADDQAGSSDTKTADLAGNEEENVVSMVDVLEENQELEAEATAVLGDSDDKFCTYPQVMHFIIIMIINPSSHDHQSRSSVLLTQCSHLAVYQCHMACVLTLSQCATESCNQYKHALHNHVTFNFNIV